MKFLFIDTNILLHYKRPREIDWVALGNEVTLIVSSVVVRELDKQKSLHPSQKIRRRAQIVINDLTDVAGLPNGKIKDGLTIQFLVHEPSLDFNAHNLRIEIADDWFLASVIEWRSKNPGADFAVVTADLGVTLKAKAFAIPILGLSDSEKLAEGADADEQKVRAMERELAELKNAKPVLRVSFADSEPLFKAKITAPSNVDANWLESEMQKLRSEFPPLAPPTKSDHQNIARSMFASIGMKLRGDYTVEEANEYNSRLGRFFREYEKYLHLQNDFENLRKRMVEIEIILINEGLAPAEDIDVEMHFPDGFQLFDKENDEIPCGPDEPEPPERPDKVWDGTFIAPPILRSNLDFRGPPINRPTIKRTNSYDVHYDLRRLKHHSREAVGRFVLLFDDFTSARSFAINYTLTVGNLPRKVVGQISIALEKSPQAG